MEIYEYILKFLTLTFLPEINTNWSCWIVFFRTAGSRLLMFYLGFLYLFTNEITCQSSLFTVLSGFGIKGAWALHQLESRSSFSCFLGQFELVGFVSWKFGGVYL